eukprot:TRINITY_DN37673_c0_g1_i1.p1 TRINITY_DN37673_c0_g1~~TRINITY_DN37673_c0_g1_i1.p1  ORF type:complete len:499 (-),score=77.08 TRINITY_DN37673_c0_g1_i1:541-2037(-)
MASQPTPRMTQTPRSPMVSRRLMPTSPQSQDAVALGHSASSASSASRPGSRILSSSTMSQSPRDAQLQQQRKLTKSTGSVSSTSILQSQTLSNRRRAHVCSMSAATPAPGKAASVSSTAMSMAPASARKSLRYQEEMSSTQIPQEDSLNLEENVCEASFVSVLEPEASPDDFDQERDLLLAAISGLREAAEAAIQRAEAAEAACSAQLQRVLEVKLSSAVQQAVSRATEEATAELHLAVRELKLQRGNGIVQESASKHTCSYCGCCLRSHIGDTGPSQQSTLEAPTQSSKVLEKPSTSTSRWTGRLSPRLSTVEVTEEPQENMQEIQNEEITLDDDEFAEGNETQAVRQAGNPGRVRNAVSHFERQVEKSSSTQNLWRNSTGTCFSPRLGLSPRLTVSPRINASPSPQSSASRAIRSNSDQQPPLVRSVSECTPSDRRYLSSPRCSPGPNNRELQSTPTPIEKSLESKLVVTDSSERTKLDAEAEQVSKNQSECSTVM